MNKSEVPGTVPERSPSPKRLDQVRTACRRRALSYATEQAYLRWIKRYVLFHGTRHPTSLGTEHVRIYLRLRRSRDYLALERDVAASTQNQALNALVFLYREVLQADGASAMDLGAFGPFVRAREPKRLPLVLSRPEVARILGCLEGTPRLVASLLYGSGLRLSEALRLRVKDLDFHYSQIADRTSARPPWQRSKGPRYNVARDITRAVAAATAARPSAARTGSGGRFWCSLPPTRAGTKVSQGPD